MVNNNLESLPEETTCFKFEQGVLEDVQGLDHYQALPNSWEQ